MTGTALRICADFGHELDATFFVEREGRALSVRWESRSAAAGSGRERTKQIRLYVSGEVRITSPKLRSGATQSAGSSRGAGRAGWRARPLAPLGGAGS